MITHKRMSYDFVNSIYTYEVLSICRACDFFDALQAEPVSASIRLPCSSVSDKLIHGMRHSRYLIEQGMEVIRELSKIFLLS